MPAGSTLDCALHALILDAHRDALTQQKDLRCCTRHDEKRQPCRRDMRDKSGWRGLWEAG